MKKLLCFALSVSFFVTMAFSAAAAEEVPALDVSGWSINSIPIAGPEGIVCASDGTIYMGGHDGRIWAISPTGQMSQFADLNNLPGQREEKIGAVGVAMDAEENLYVATLDFDGGCVLKVAGPGKPGSGAVSVFRRGIGMANFVLIDKDSSTMYVSDSSMFSGRVFRFNMADTARVGAAADEKGELVGKFRYANGLALSPDKQSLFVAETTSGRISKVNLKTMQAEPFVELGGWTDGLCFEPTRQLLFACDNKGGRISAVDLTGKLVGDVRLLGREGQCAPASLIFPDPDTILVTDLWRASMFRALIGRPQYHSYAYRISAKEILK